MTNWYDELNADKNYQAECDELLAIIRQQHSVAATLLDVGCGTGKHLEILQHHFDCSGLDVNSEMLQQAATRARCPLHCANMMSFSLNRQYDVIMCLFGCPAYTRTREGLSQLVRQFIAHLNVAGLVLLEPFVSRDAFVAKTRKRTVGNINIVSECVVNNNILYLKKIYHRGQEVRMEEFEVALFNRSDYDDVLAENGLDISWMPPSINFSKGLCIGRYNG